MQCALDTSTRDVLTPTPIVPDLCVQQVACGGGPFTVLERLARAWLLCISGMHSLALTKDGQVWTWGEPWGDFSMSQERTPRCVRDTNDTIMVQHRSKSLFCYLLNLTDCMWRISQYGIESKRSRLYLGNQ